MCSGFWVEGWFRVHAGFRVSGLGFWLQGLGPRRELPSGYSSLEIKVVGAFGVLLQGSGISVFPAPELKMHAMGTRLFLVPQNPRTPKSKKPKTPKPQKPKTPKAQNPKTPKPQNPKTPKLQNPKLRSPNPKPPQNDQHPKP